MDPTEKIEAPLSDLREHSAALREASSVGRETNVIGREAIRAIQETPKAFGDEVRDTADHVGNGTAWLIVLYFALKVALEVVRSILAKRDVKPPE